MNNYVQPIPDPSLEEFKTQEEVGNKTDVLRHGSGFYDNTIHSAHNAGNKGSQEVPTMEYVPKRMSNNDRRPGKKKKKMGGSSSFGRCLYGFIIFLSTMALIFAAIVHIFAWYEEEIEMLKSLRPRKIDWFRQPRMERWREVGCLMEVNWTFWIWIAVFFLQLMWIFYGMILTCRRTKDGNYLYENAATMPCTIYLVFLVALGATGTWNVFWGQSGAVGSDYSQWGTIVIAVAALFFHIALAIAVKAFITSIADLRILNKKYDLCWNQTFTQNGLAAIASWESVVTMYAITWVLEKRNLVPEVVNFSCCVGLSLIMLYLLVWFLLDLFFTKKSLYYIFTPYFICGVSFVSALVRNIGIYSGDITDNISLILSGVYLSVTGLFIVIKVITVIVRGRYSSDEKDEVRSLHDDNVYVMQ